MNKQKEKITLSPINGNKKQIGQLSKDSKTNMSNNEKEHLKNKKDENTNLLIMNEYSYKYNTDQMNSDNNSIINIHSIA
jgi:hypothetical protein